MRTQGSSLCGELGVCLFPGTLSSALSIVGGACSPGSSELCPEPPAAGRGGASTLGAQPDGGSLAGGGYIFGAGGAVSTFLTALGVSTSLPQHARNRSRPGSLGLTSCQYFCHVRGLMAAGILAPLEDATSPQGKGQLCTVRSSHVGTGLHGLPHLGTCSLLRKPHAVPQPPRPAPERPAGEAHLRPPPLGEQME